MNWSAEIRFADMRSEAGISCTLEHPECAFIFGCSRVISSTGAILPYPKQERVEHEHYLPLFGRLRQSQSLLRDHCAYKQADLHGGCVYQ
jgi:hypothetical protein